MDKMSEPSWQSHEKYNQKVYDRINIRLPKELVAAFKEKCAAENVSQAQIIKSAIEAYLNN